MSPTPEALRLAADQLASARKACEQGDAGLQRLRQSRVAFIHSLRNTGLSYAQARLKYDNCLEAALRRHQHDAARLLHLEREYRKLCGQAAAPAL